MFEISFTHNLDLSETVYGKIVAVSQIDAIQVCKGVYGCWSSGDWLGSRSGRLYGPERIFDHDDETDISLPGIVPRLSWLFEPMLNIYKK